MVHIQSKQMDWVVLMFDGKKRAFLLWLSIAAFACGLLINVFPSKFLSNRQPPRLHPIYWEEALQIYAYGLCYFVAIAIFCFYLLTRGPRNGGNRDKDNEIKSLSEDKKKGAWSHNEPD